MSPSHPAGKLAAGQPPDPRPAGPPPANRSHGSNHAALAGKAASGPKPPLKL